MKKFITLLISAIAALHSFAVVIPVTVANFSFNPSTVNATVGDVIKFNWSNGNHTTTCGSGLTGTSLPAGAAEWNSPMNSGTTSFSYTLTVAGTYHYGCIIHGAGMVGTLNVGVAVPVTFGDFSATAANKHVSLNWTTLTEENTSHFSVNKSTDGIHFIKAADIPAAGNSNSMRSYSYSDDISADKYRFIYYEIVTVDLDNRESLSPIKTVRSDASIDDLIVQLGPNPIVRPDMMRILFNADRRGQMDVKIYSLGGKLVLSDKIEAFYGLNNSHLHVCELPAGQYVAVLSLDGKKESRKIIIK